MKIRIKLFIVFSYFILITQISYSQKIWYKKSDFKGGARSGAINFVINETAYVGLGDSASIYRNDFWKYDAHADSWTKVADFPGEARSMSVAFTLKGKAYVGLGMRTLPTVKVYTDFYEYDPTLNTWTKIADYPGGGRYGAVAFTVSDTAYVGTGRDADFYLKDFWKFTNGTWTKIADLSDGERAFAVGFSYGNKGYIGSGIFYEDYYTEVKNSMYAYNTGTGNWEETIFADSKLGVQYASAYVLNDTAWIMYGSLKQALAFDPKTKTIQYFDDKIGLGKERNSNISFVINGKPYFGLGNYYESSKTIYTKDIWTYGYYNYPPTNISLSDSVMQDKCPTGTMVAILSTTDKTANDAFTYALVSGNGTNDVDNTFFSISGDTLKTLGSIDFSVKPGYKIYIKTTDKEDASYSQAFTISKMYFKYNSKSGLPASSFNKCQWIDFNNDGKLDVIYEQPFKLFRNNGDDTFTDVSEILNGAQYVTGVACNDFNNDGNIDIITMRDSGSKLYVNKGDGTFTMYDKTGLPNSEGYLTCADYNRDGFTDILFNNRLFQNNGNYFFTEQTDLILPVADLSAAAWADYDNDGWPDFAVMGRITSSEYCRLYKNNGDGTFSLQSQSFPSFIDWGSFDWGDYNNDGKLDLLILGGYKLLVYKNNGDGSFTDINLTYPGYGLGKANWGDLDNDGYLDIIACGFTANNNTTQVYKNNKNVGFDLLPANLPPSDYNILGDYDNDGKLDILITGQETSNGKSITRLYKNIVATIANTAPSKPANLISTVNNETVTLTWDKANDAETGQNGLTYNIRVGIVPGGNQVIPSHSDPVNGKLRIIKTGNCGPNNSFSMKLPKGNYYWSIQAIDGGFGASEWAPEQTFSISASSVKLKQCISFLGSSNYTYGADSIKLIFNATSGLPITLNIPQNDTAIVKNDTLFIKRAGTITINATQAGNESYETCTLTRKIVINKKELKYTGENIIIQYGDTPPDIKVIYDGFVKNENETVLDTKPSLESFLTSYDSPGIYPYYSYPCSDNNYDLKYVNTGNIIINKKELKYRGEKIIMQYGDTPPAIKVIYDGFVNNENETVLDTKPSLESLVTYTSSPGIYPYNSYPGSDNDYDLKYVNTGNIEVTKRTLKVIPQNDEMVYGDNPKTIVINYKGFALYQDESTLQMKPTFQTRASNISFPGSYPYLLTNNPEDSRYKFVYSDSTSLTIKKRPLDITPENVEKFENEENPTIALKFSGFVNQHTADSLQVLPSIVHNVSKNSPAGTYPISLEGGNDSRYSYVFNNGTFTIKLNTGIIEGTDEKISIYPVPLSETTYIDLPFNKPVTVKIINAKGIVYYIGKTDKKLLEINTSNYEKGIYIFNVETDKETINTKVLK